MKVRNMAAALLATAALSAGPAMAEGGVKAGFLRCNVEGGTGFIFGSSRDMSCVYSPDGGGRADDYSGSISRYGVDIGYHEASVVIWAVLAPTSDVGEGALAGSYGGASASVAAAFGAGANVLVGGFEDSIALQPLSVEGIEGINVAAGVAGLSLDAE